MVLRISRSFLLPPLLAPLVAAATAVDPPSLRCASVDIAGDVTLTWVVPPDPSSSFAEYRIYTSAVQAGPYAQVGSILVYGQNTFLHVGAGADLGARYYYLTTVSLDTPPIESQPSDTLSTIFLTVGQSTPLGSAVLGWSLLHTPPIPTSNTNELVQLEHPLGTWSQIAQVTNTDVHYQQVIAICQDSLTYRIAQADQLGCVSYSNLTGDVFSDVTAPTPPVIVGVSVDTATNQTVVDWDPSPEPDTQGYIIVLAQSGGNVIVDTIYGQNNTIYQWTGSDAGAGTESYTIAAIDTCYSGNPPAPNTSATNSAHGTIFVRTLYDRCAAQITVVWTPYVGWPVSQYDLYVRVDNGPTQQLGTFSSATLSYAHTDVEPFHTYCYVVKAVGLSPGQVSLSNNECRVTAYPAIPQWNYLRLATVEDEDHVLVVDSVDLSARAHAYRLERTFNGGPWEAIASAPGGSSPTVVFNDMDVTTAERSYLYRVIVEDSCGTDVVTSNTGTSILLTAQPGLDATNQLRWNGYEHWDGNVQGYEVQRSIDEDPFTPIAFNPPGQWEYVDDVSDYIGSRGRFCYRVVAVETGNGSGLNAESVSNEACAVQQEAVWVPNAFIAGGVNHDFKPVLAFVDVRTYQFIIYNRWGQEIWSTTDPNEAWKGQIDGSYVPQGVYAYYCAVNNGAGKKYEERGTVTFLCCP